MRDTCEGREAGSPWRWRVQSSGTYLGVASGGRVGTAMLLHERFVSSNWEIVRDWSMTVSATKYPNDYVHL